MYLFEYVRGLTDQEVRMEWFDAGNAKNSLRYEGIAKQGTPTGSPSWTIRRFEYVDGIEASTKVISRIQVLEGSWDGRAALPWL